MPLANAMVSNVAPLPVPAASSPTSLVMGRAKRYLVAHIVVFQCSLCAWINQRAVCLNGFPLRTLCSHIASCFHAVCIGDNLDFSVDKSHASAPVPNISVQVCNTEHSVIVIPRRRAASGRRSARFSGVAICACAFKCRPNTSLVGVGNILAPLVITMRHSSVFLAPQCNRSPQGEWHKSPAFAFLLTSVYCRLPVQATLRVLHRQAVRPVINNYVVIFGNADFLFLNSVYNECRVSGSP